MKFPFRIVLSLVVFFAFSANVFSQNDVFNVARSGTVEDLRALINQDSEVINTKNENGFTPLILACYKGNVAVAKFLIEKSKTIDTSSDMGTPIMAATYKGQLELVKLLLENNANPNIADSNGTTPLIYAAMFGNTNIMSLLLKYKADKTHKDKDGKTAFEFAVFSGNQEIINQLKN
ncbi:ankyrin repeat domain-containing protein [Flavobacterium sp.]|uniref:ankyrin repeat domain-containing protein n=1 Tax=Flavobacterium sp. TaxID=239 RepID=UPI0037535AC9